VIFMADNVIDTKAEKKRLKEEKKKLKQEQKNQRKEARQRAKELALEEANLSDDEESGGFSVFLVTAIIILVWLGIIGLLIKLDVGGFGSQVLAPVLSDVPVLNKILPESEETESTTGEDYGGYSNLKDAVNDVEALKVQLESAQATVNADAEKITELQNEVTRLKTFEDKQLEFMKRLSMRKKDRGLMNILNIMSPWIRKQQKTFTKKW